MAPVCRGSARACVDVVARDTVRQTYLARLVFPSNCWFGIFTRKGLIFVCFFELISTPPVCERCADRTIWKLNLTSLNHEDAVLPLEDTKQPKCFRSKLSLCPFEPPDAHDNLTNIGAIRNQNLGKTVTIDVLDR